MSDIAFEALLAHTVDIQRRQEGGVGSLGVPTETFSTIYTSVACRIEDTKGTFILEREGKEISVDAIGFFKITQDIQDDDIVVFGAKKYSVYFIEDAGAEAHHYEVGLKLL